MRFLIALLILLGPVAVHAADSVRLDSRVFVERIEQPARGNRIAVLTEPAIVVPGDRLVYRVSYENAGKSDARGLVVTNRISPAVAFQAADRRDVVVSVDGGARWGALSALRIRDADGTWRNARPEDVTHVRWRIAGPTPPGGKGFVSFRGIVR